MTVEDLIALLKQMPPESKVFLAVPQPGDDYYVLDSLDLWESGDVILEATRDE